jgi:hypothetical protein
MGKMRLILSSVSRSKDLVAVERCGEVEGSLESSTIWWLTSWHPESDQSYLRPYKRLRIPGKQQERGGSSSWMGVYARMRRIP